MTPTSLATSLRVTRVRRLTIWKVSEGYHDSHGGMARRLGAQVSTASCKERRWEHLCPAQQFPVAQAAGLTSAGTNKTADPNVQPHRRVLVPPSREGRLVQKSTFGLIPEAVAELVDLCQVHDSHDKPRGSSRTTRGCWRPRSGRALSPRPGAGGEPGELVSRKGWGTVQIWLRRLRSSCSHRRRRERRRAPL